MAMLIFVHWPGHVAASCSAAEVWPITRPHGALNRPALTQPIQSIRPHPNLCKPAIMAAAGPITEAVGPADSELESQLRLVASENGPLLVLDSRRLAALPAMLQVRTAARGTE